MTTRDRWLFAAAFVPLALCVAIPALTTAAGGKEGSAPPPASQSDEMIKADTMPVVLTRVLPVYPAEEKEAGVEGQVILRAYVNPKGALEELIVVTGVEGHPAFATAASDALRKWTFKPAEAAGKPIAVWIQIPIRFALDEKEKK